MPIFPTASDKFEHKLSQLAKSLNSIRLKMTRPSLYRNENPRKSTEMFRMSTSSRPYTFSQHLLYATVVYIHFQLQPTMPRFRFVFPPPPY